MKQISLVALFIFYCCPGNTYFKIFTYNYYSPLTSIYCYHFRLHVRIWDTIIKMTDMTIALMRIVIWHDK